MDTNLAEANPGKISHSRWLTLANRVLRLYVSVIDPSPNLMLLTKYVIKVYAKMWIVIKSKPSFFYGSANVFNLISESRFLPTEFHDVVKRCIQRNWFYLHPENILLSMLTDQRVEISEMAFNKCQELITTVGQVRKFLSPKLNFEANEYFNVVSFPPILREVVGQDFCLTTIRDFLFCMKNIPCHSQQVKRHVKLVTDAASHVIGESRRDGVIFCKVQSQKENPKFLSKK